MLDVINMIDIFISFLHSAKPWLSALGLFFDMGGVWLLSKDLLITEDEAIKGNLSYWSGDNKEENLKDPRVRNALAQSKSARIGVKFVLIGFFLQLLGSLPFGK